MVLKYLTVFHPAIFRQLPNLGVWSGTACDSTVYIYTVRGTYVGYNQNTLVLIIKFFTSSITNLEPKVKRDNIELQRISTGVVIATIFSTHLIALDEFPLEEISF